MGFKVKKIILILPFLLIFPFFLKAQESITLNPPASGCSGSNSFVNLSWTTISDSPIYYILRRAEDETTTSTIASTTNNFYLDETVLSDRNYFYQIKAVRGSDVFYSNIVQSLATYCPPVLSLQTSCQADGPYVNLSWTQVSGNLSFYEVYRGTTKIATTSATNFDDGPNLEAGKFFDYSIKAIWQDGVSTTSQPISTLIPACPPILTVSIGCLGDAPGGPSVSLSWNSLFAVQKYQIYRKAQTEPDFSLLEEVTITSYTDNLVQTLPSYWQGGDISYYVKAIWSDAQSNSEVFQDQIPRCSPYLTVQTNCEESPDYQRAYYLSWTATRDAYAYNIYKNGGYYFQVTSTSFSDSICAEGICTTTYQVIALAPGEMLSSNSVEKFVDCVTVVPPSPAPVLNPPDVYCLGTDSTVYLSWTPSDNVFYYSVIRNATETVKTRNTFFEDKGVQSGYTYTYFVIAYGKEGTSTTSPNSVTITAIDCTPPVAPALALDRGCLNGLPYITLSWTDAGNVESYDVYRGLSSTNLSKIITFLKGSPEFTNRTWTDSNVSTSITYYYQIVANGPPGVPSASSSIQSITTLSCLPTTPYLYSPSQNCVSGSPRVYLSWWSDGANTQSFEIFRNGNFLTPVGASTRNYPDLSVSPVTYYEYRIDAIGYLGQRVSSNIRSITTYDCTPPGPFTLNEPSISCQDGYPRATLSWSTSTNSTSYDLYRYLINPDGSIGATTTFYSVTSPYTDFGLGNALNFDGSNDYVRIPNSSSLQITGDLTISFWAYPTNVSKGRQNPLGKAYGGEFNLTMETSGQLSYYHGSAGGNNWPYMDCYANNIFSNNRMVQVTIVRNVASKTVTIYKNGIAQTTYCSGWVDPSPSNRDLRIGYEYAGYWQGWLDEIRIYNRSLNPSEISDLFNGVDIRDGLVGLWHFDEGSPSQFVSDSSNYLNNGILGSTAGSDGNDPSWIENGLQWNKTYMWQVRANGPGGSTLSNTTTPATLPLCSPTKPGLRLTAFCDETTHLPGVTVRWSFSTNATIYEIYREDKGLIATATQSIDPVQRVFVDNNGGTGLSENTSYTYWVKAIDSIGPTESDHLTIITPVCVLPTTPQNVTASFECSGPNPQVKITWSDSDYADSYRVYRNDGWVSDRIADTNSPTYTFYDTSVRTNTTYIYRVKAFGPGGESDFSDPATTTTGFCPPSQPSIKFLTTDCQSGSPFNQIYWSDPDVDARIIFYDDFESGDFSKWSGTFENDGTTSVESTDPYWGTYHSQFVLNPTNNWDGYGGSYYNPPGNYTALYSRVYYKFDTLPPDGYGFEFSSMLTDYWEDRSGVSLVNQGGQYFWALYFNNTTTYSGPFVPQTNKWYSIELYTKVGSIEGAARAWIDGELKLTISNRDVSRDSRISQVRASVYTNGPPGTQRTFKIDSVFVSDHYIGPGIPIYNANQYKIYRNTSGSAPTESDLIKTINSNDPEFLSRSWKDDVNLNQQMTYYYWVKSIGPAGESSLSSPLSIKTYFCGTPSTPTLNLEQLYCEDNLPYAKLSWNTVSNAYSYNLYRTNPDNSLSTYSTRLSPLTDRGSFALKFDGIDDYGKVEKNDDTLNKFSAGLTVEVWGKQTSYTSQRDSWLLDKDYTGYRIWGTDRLRFGIRTPTQGWIMIGNTQPTLNQWYHLVGVVDNIGLKMYLYVNGQPEATTTLPEKYNFDYSSNLLTFGKHSGWSYYWPGEIAEIRIYGRAISPTEVQEHYQGIYKNETELRGAWHFDEGRGVTIFDSSGNSNHGIIAGPSWINSKDGLGKALEFGGMNGYISLPNSASLDITNPPLSIFAWIKGNSTAVDAGWIVAKNYWSASNVQYGMFWRPGEKRIQVYLNGGNRVQTPDNSVLPNQWYFVGFTWDGQYVRAYINGTSSATSTYSGTLTSQPYLRIGRRESAAYPFKGAIDEVRIYNRTLTSEEISNLFNGIEISSSGLVGLWHFDEGSGNTAYDSSPYKNDGTLVKGADWISPSDAPTQVYVQPLEREKTYRYYVRSVGVGIESPNSNEISFTTPSCLPQKPDLVATTSCAGGNPQIILSWQSDPNTLYWSVYKKRATDPTFTHLLNTTLTSSTDGNVESGIEYEYYVTAFGKGVSENSDVVLITAPYCQPPPYNGVAFPITATPADTCYGRIEGSSRIEIKWSSDPTGNTLSYNIWRMRVSDGEVDFSLIATDLGPLAQSYTDLIPIALEGKDFKYKVEAVGSGPNNSTFSQVSATATAPVCYKSVPGWSQLKIVGYVSTADIRIVYLSWTDAGNEDYYEIYRSGSDFSLIATTSGETIPTDKKWYDSSADRDLFDGTLYTYYVIPTNDNGDGPMSNQESIFLPIAPPGSFDLSGQKTDTTIHLTWTLAATTTAGGPATYKILRSSSREDFSSATTICDNILETQPLECDDLNPTVLERFYVAVATNLGGSTYSNVWESVLPLPKWKEIAPY